MVVGLGPHFFHWRKKTTSIGFLFIGGRKSTCIGCLLESTRKGHLIPGAVVFSIPIFFPIEKPLSLRQFTRRLYVVLLVLDDSIVPQRSEMTTWCAQLIITVINDDMVCMNYGLVQLERTTSMITTMTCMGD